jgi:hypothetical protein
LSPKSLQRSTRFRHHQNQGDAIPPTDRRPAWAVQLYCAQHAGHSCQGPFLWQGKSTKEPVHSKQFECSPHKWIQTHLSDVWSTNQNANWCDVWCPKPTTITTFGIHVKSETIPRVCLPPCARFVNWEYFSYTSVNNILQAISNATRVRASSTLVYIEPRLQRHFESHRRFKQNSDPKQALQVAKNYQNTKYLACKREKFSIMMWQYRHGSTLFIQLSNFTPVRTTK